MRRSSTGRRAFTLLELLVSMSVLVILGGSLILILRGGLATWRRGEARQTTYAAAQSVLGQLREDLTAVAPPYDTPPGGLGDVDARMLCEVDAAGRPTLFFVRTIKAESEHPITGLAGNTIGADSVVDYRDDLDEARASRLRATGGLMEVGWVLGQDGVLYRGMKAPVGPPGSLFELGGYDLAPPVQAIVEAGERPAQGAAPVPGAAPPGAPAPAAPGVAALLRPFATDVLFLEYRFWHQHCTTWSVDRKPVKFPREREQSGPLQFWDSTRAILAPVDANDPRRFETFKAQASLQDPRDDILPAKVRIELTLREAPAAGSTTTLTRPITARDTELFVQEPGRLGTQGGHLLIDDEWIQYSEVVGERVTVTKRGARATRPADHVAMMDVVAGRTFVVVVAVPARREDWSDREAR